MITYLSVIVVPLVIGWFYGKNNVNPYSTFGKEYYSKNDWDWK